MRYTDMGTFTQYNQLNLIVELKYLKLLFISCL
jgi:hypothetical protein